MAAWASSRIDPVGDLACWRTSQAGPAMPKSSQRHHGRAFCPPIAWARSWGFIAAVHRAHPACPLMVAPRASSRSCRRRAHIVSFHHEARQPPGDRQAGPCLGLVITLEHGDACRPSSRARSCRRCDLMSIRPGGAAKLTGGVPTSARDAHRDDRGVDVALESTAASRWQRQGGVDAAPPVLIPPRLFGTPELAARRCARVDRSRKAATIHERPGGYDASHARFVG